MKTSKFSFGLTEFLYLLVIALGILASGAIVSDLSYMSTKTASESSLSTYTAGNADIEAPNRLLLQVEGDDALSRTVQSSLSQKFHSQGVEVYTAGDDKNKSVIIVSAVNRTVLYTPFYSRANIDLFVYYSTNGTEYYRSLKAGNATVELPSNESAAIRAGRIKVKRTDQGLFSLGNYHSSLSDSLADEIAQRMFE